MIKIDKHNVEAFYLDYLEGNLSEKDTAVLLSFLEENPKLSELFEETEDLLTLKLEPSSISFGSGEELKLFPCDDDEICLANIDYWLIAKKENTLTPSAEKEVNAFVKANDLTQNEDYISAAYLRPNMSESYGDVRGLKKQGGTIIPLLIRFSSVAAIFVFVWLIWTNSETVNQQYSARLKLSGDYQVPLYESPKEIAIAKTDIIIHKTNSNLRSLVKNKPEDSKVVAQPVNKKDFEIFKSTFPNIAVSDKLAFNNPPNSLEESIDLSAMFSDFEEIIASNKKSQYNNDVAIQQTSNSIYQLEEQFRPVTTRLSNLTSLDMSYKKMPEAASMNQTVIQIGKFSFERKKNK